jgi:hypothetical protein
MHKFYQFLLFYFAFYGTMCLSAPIRYELKDIEALISTDNYQEFFEHIYDVRPSERTDIWKSSVEAMAEKYIALLKNQKIQKEDFDLLTDIFEITHLKQDEFFREKRDSILIKYLSEYVSENTNEDIVKTALNLSKKYPENIRFHVNIINTITLKLLELEQNTLKYLDQTRQITQKITSSPFSEFYCGKNPLSKVLKTQIYFLKNTWQTFDPTCLEKLVTHIRDDLNSENIIKRQKAYTFLDNQKKLTQKEKAKYHVVNMIYGMKYEKEEWDMVFESLKYLGEHHQQREDLINILKKHDPFPDTVFQIHDDKKTIGLSRIISRYFPEFLDKYTHYCLTYLSGEKKYPHGNPTPNCHRYMKISKKSQSSPDTVQTQYDEIMNAWKK